MEGILEGSVPPGSYTLLQCRTVRIGSYKVVPKEPVIISSLGVRIAVPCTDDENESVPITVDLGEVVKALIYFGRGRGIPVIFLYTLPAVGARVRATLNMDDDTRPYFDPSSADETQRWITLLPESLQEDSKVALKTIFGPLDNVLSELDKEKANDILVRTSPKVHIPPVVRLSKAGPAGLEPWAPTLRLEHLTRLAAAKTHSSFLAPSWPRVLSSDPLNNSNQSDPVEPASISGIECLMSSLVLRRMMLRCGNIFDSSVACCTSCHVLLN
uniref:Uncharacterized protein n=1 Tax=Timema bartmani TaxID=61472 RepID=A0A7R9F5Z7_9NEOP|nr:unnamed protein product [Timema bartmani]